jgi:hypothetical protein
MADRLIEVAQQFHLGSQRVVQGGAGAADVGTDGFIELAMEHMNPVPGQAIERIDPAGLRPRPDFLRQGIDLRQRIGSRIHAARKRRTQIAFGATIRSTGDQRCAHETRTVGDVQLVRHVGTGGQTEHRDPIGIDCQRRKEPCINLSIGMRHLPAQASNQQQPRRGTERKAGPFSD